MGPTSGVGSNNSSPDTQACLPRDTSSSAEEMASRALTATPPAKRRPSKPPSCILWPLVPLRAALFCFFGGLGCLLVFLPLHMREVGLPPEHARLVSIVAPLVALLGPLVVGPAADRLGKHKVLLTACLLLSAATYCLLLAVPVASSGQGGGAAFRQESLIERPPAVRLKCEPNSASIIQERCAPLCPSWREDQVWEVEIRDCRLDCEDPQQPGGTSELPGETTHEPETERPVGSRAPGLEIDTIPDYEVKDEVEALPAGSGETDEEKQEALRKAQEEKVIAIIGKAKPHPYLCFSNETGSESGGRFCSVFTEKSEDLLVNVSLPEVASSESECKYPLTNVRLQLNNRSFSSLQCRAPKNCFVYCSLGGRLWDRASDGNQLCPAPLPITDPSTTFWSYLLARSVADIFPTAAVPLADTLVVVLARDHHTDVGRELAWGALGAGLLVPAVTALVIADITPWPETPSALPILAFAFLALLAAAALSGVRLRPAWYSRRLEMEERAAPRLTNAGEAIGLVIVLLLLGFFWGALDTYLPWYLTDSGDSTSVIGLTVTLGTLLAFPLLWNSERLIDYCGHTNLFIVSFAFYIIRFTGFGFMDETWLGVGFEIFEVFTLCLMWVTAVVYTRQLVAPHLTATGQAVIVLAHFGLGRFLGSLVGGVTLASATAPQLYQALALAAALLGWLYFSVYHCCLRPRCGRKIPPPPESATDGVTSNGSYTPLRVYNGGGEQQKREMRY